MERIEDIYKRLSDVDIYKQNLIWDDRGKGYYGEFCVFQKLFYKVEGNAKFLMNLQIPTTNGKTTEIDLLMIHETGIYSFEIKHFKGTIYGKTTNKIWTQYFRTAPNQTFKNPILQNGYHIKALEKLFPGLPIRSVVVFSNPECDLRVENDDGSVLVAELRNLVYLLERNFNEYDDVLDIEKIDSIFNELKFYSPFTERQLVAENEEIFYFYDYLGFLKKDMDEKAKKENQDYKSKTKRLSIIFLSILIAMAVVCTLIISIISVFQTYKIETLNKDINEKTICLEELEKAINEMPNILDIVEISKVNLRHRTLTDAAFSCNLKCISDYGFMLTPNTQYLITLNSGKEIAYDMFGERLQYAKQANTLSYNESGNLKTLVMKNIKPESIKSIKITNISIWKTNINDELPLIKGVVLEVYNKK